MKRLVFAALAALLALGLFAPVLADGGGDVDAYIQWRTRWRVLPRIFRRTRMSDWSIVVPVATTNKVLNPSAETTGNYAAVGATVTRSTAFQKWGVYSYHVVSAADDDGMSVTLSTLANAIHYVTMFVRGTLPADWDWTLDGGVTDNTPVAVLAIDSNWTLYGFEFPAAQATGSVSLEIRQNGAGAGDFYIDGIQVEEHAYWTTYCDGDQDGCEWNAAEHASTSDRSAQSRAGGRPRDFKDYYNFGVSEFLGTGMAPLSLSVDEYALLPGGELNAEKTHARTFTLVGTLKGTGATCDIHAARQALVEELAHDRYPKDAKGWQPIRLWFTGATVVKEISAFYVTGLEASIKLENRIHEKLPVRFIAPDPYWYEIGESSDVLDEEDSLTFTIVARRVRDTGQWDDMGPPDAAGTYTQIWAIAEGQDGTIYIGGNFLNFDNIAD
ncbi:MAG: phage tail family protein, partial [Planctomycetota bacterium]